MKTKTDYIYSTALAYACYKSGPKRVDDNLLKNMFRDLCLLSDEYAFDYKQELKNILTESEDQIYIETLNGPEIRDNGKNYK